MGAPQPNERDVDRGEVHRRGAENEKPVGPRSSLMTPMTIAMVALVVIVLAAAAFWVFT